MDDVGCIEHLPVAHGHGTDPLVCGIAEGLAQGGFDGGTVPGERPGSLDLHYQALDAQFRQDDVGPPDLEVDVRDRPVEHPGEQVFEDVLGDLLDGGVEEPLPEALPALLGVRRPRRSDAFHAAPVRRQVRVARDVRFGRHRSPGSVCHPEPGWAHGQKGDGAWPKAPGPHRSGRRRRRVRLALLRAKYAMAGEMLASA